MVIVIDCDDVRDRSIDLLQRGQRHCRYQLWCVNIGISSDSIGFPLSKIADEREINDTKTNGGNRVVFVIENFRMKHSNDIRFIVRKWAHGV